MTVFEKEKIDIPEEHDFFANPGAKMTLRLLRQKLDTLPQDEKAFEMLNWAVRKKLLKPGYIETWKNCQKKPVPGTVVMPGYARLENAYHWLKKLEELDAKIAKEQENADPQRANPDLPF